MNDQIETVMLDAEASQMAPERVLTPPPASVVASLLPPVAVDVMRQNRAEPRFDIAVKEMDAQDFFMSLVADTPYNMVVHPSVEGTLTLTLKDVTIEQVMTTVRTVYGYESQRNEMGFLVLPAKLQTRVFHIDYLNLKRSGVSSTWVSYGQGSQGESGDGGESSGSKSALSSGTITRTESDFWGDLKGSLKALITDSEDGTVVLNAPSSLAIVRAYPDDLRAVEKFLQVMHKNLNRQVILEAKIIEVILSEGFQSGINWAALGRSGANDSILIGQTGGGTILNNNPALSGISGNTGLLDPANLQQISGTTASAFGGMFSTAISMGRFSAFIELLESQGSVQVLSSPRVSTINNQKAVIKVGSDEYFVTKVSNPTTGGGVDATSSPEITLTPFFSGIALDVTPHIDKNDNVILHVHPSVSDVTDQIKQIIIDGENQSLPMALSSIRESDSIVRARSGQIIAIGGLMKTYTQTETAGVPILKDLPFIGAAFQHNLQRTIKTELVILLRPIVSGTPASDRYMSETRARIQNLQSEIKQRHRVSNIEPEEESADEPPAEE
ncbi:MAG: pilus (MSHA type) biogenesis protein MshL [Candidatus Polarisedimenticolaceae bacterium]|nr:pilus (MSHA type) biogenesis protein MshL [Candidatus Polarisedimenticolaceae bacterium]